MSSARSKAGDLALVWKPVAVAAPVRAAWALDSEYREAGPWEASDGVRDWSVHAAFCKSRRFPFSAHAAGKPSLWRNRPPLSTQSERVRDEFGSPRWNDFCDRLSAGLQPSEGRWKVGSAYRQGLSSRSLARRRRWVSDLHGCTRSSSNRTRERCVMISVLSGVPGTRPLPPGLS